MLIRKDFKLYALPSSKRPFESLVNTEGFQTNDFKYIREHSLRVLLIRKDFKHLKRGEDTEQSLRVLLIRKDFKLTRCQNGVSVGLRVLLIRKDFKPEEEKDEAANSLRVLLIRKDFKPAAAKLAKLSV